MDHLHCKICGNTAENRPFMAREMMFGTREEFRYFECSSCGCVQIHTIPADLSKYYPSTYYSFQPPTLLRGLIKGPWLCDPFGSSSALRRLLAFIPGARVMPEWMCRARLKRGASILEVGSGGGMRLLAMKAAGYCDLTGADPFVAADQQLPGGIHILKREVSALERSYDFVMLHHAYEHMPEPLKTLSGLKKVVNDSGTLLIRIPIAGTYAWKTYGVNWMALDPPRHLFLHTVKSFRKVAEDAGFKIVDYFFDSDVSQFWGSEQYKRDIPLRDPRSYFENRNTPLFSKAEIRRFKRETERLNREEQGDSAAFYLKKLS